MGDERKPEKGGSEISGKRVLSDAENREETQIMIIARTDNRMSMHRLREMALGERLTEWSNKAEPKLLSTFNDIELKLERAREAIESDMEDIGMLSGEEREMRIDRNIQRLGAISAIYEKQVNTYMKLSAGGGAAIFAALQRASVKDSPSEPNAERNATPPKRFGQVVDAE